MRAGLACLLLATTAFTSAAMAQPAGPQSGELTAQAPSASFDVNLDAGEVVTLTAGGDVDTILTLYGPDGRNIAQNDDVQPGDLSSRIVYVAQTAGRYRAEVTGYGGGRGAFTFEAREGVDFDLSWQARELSEQPLVLTARQPQQRQTLNLAAGEIFVATTFALTEDLDTTLTLLDARGRTVAENDDRGDGTLNSQIAYRPAEAGRYTLVTGSFSGNQAGDLILSTAIDPNAYIPFDFASIPRTPFQRDEGEITTENPETTYRFELDAGQTLLVLADAHDDQLDTVVTLNGPDGLPVAMNDDRGDDSLNSAIAFTAPQAATYELEVSGYGTTTGAYSLEASHVDASVADIVRAAFERPITLSGPERIIDTPDFRLRYTLEGDDATTEAYAQLTAETLQNAYATQIGSMGWAPPLRSEDGRYRAFVSRAGDAMGFAQPLEMLFDNPGTDSVRERLVARGMLVIDNDLGENRDEDPAALMHATVVHEFNHLVQYGYDAEEELNWMYESTASWIEVNTAGDDEDASRYAETDFTAPQLCWTTAEPGHDYGQWTLLQSLADAYGDHIVVRLWENAVAHDGLDTMAQTLSEVGTTIPDVIRRWRIQNFARNYALAPEMPFSVALGGRLKRDGEWSAGGDIEQLGASYLQVRTTGAHRYALRDGEGMEMIGLGVRNGEVEVIPMGRAGVFDAAGYDYAAIMVFSAATPPAPGDCTGEDYSIDISPATGGVGAVQYRMAAPNFLAPGATSPED